MDDRYDMTSSAIVVAAPGLLENDAYPVSGLRIEIEQWPVHGRLSIDDDGSFRYEPERDYGGLDSFRYRLVAPDSTSDGATVTINVSAVLAGGPVLRAPENDPFVVPGSEPETGEVSVDLGGASLLGASLEWVVPGVALTVPGLLVILVVVVQLVGAVAWLPYIKRFRRGLSWRSGPAVR